MMVEAERQQERMRWWIQSHDVRALAEALASISERDRAAALDEIRNGGGEMLARDVEALLRRQE
jgi:hypothetical protein